MVQKINTSYCFPIFHILFSYETYENNTFVLRVITSSNTQMQTKILFSHDKKEEVFCMEIEMSHPHVRFTSEPQAYFSECIEHAITLLLHTLL